MSDVPEYQDSHRGEHAAHYSVVFSRRLPAVYWSRRELPAIVSAMDSSAPGWRTKTKRHLDVATGTGRLRDIHPAAGLNAYFVGVDISDDMLAHAKLTPNSHQIISDVRALPLANETFELATAFRFFLNAPEDVRRAALVEVARVIAPGGIFVVNFHALSTSILGFKRRLWSRLGLRSDATVTPREIQDLLLPHFNILRELRMGVVPMSSKLPGGRLGRALCRFDSILSGTPVGRWLSAESILILTPRNTGTSSPTDSTVRATFGGHAASA